MCGDCVPGGFVNQDLPPCSPDLAPPHFGGWWSICQCLTGLARYRADTLPSARTTLVRSRSVWYATTMAMMSATVGSSQ